MYAQQIIPALAISLIQEFIIYRSVHIFQNMHLPPLCVMVSVYTVSAATIISGLVLGSSGELV